MFNRNNKFLLLINYSICTMYLSSNQASNQRVFSDCSETIKSTNSLHLLHSDRSNWLLRSWNVSSKKIKTRILRSLLWITLKFQMIYPSKVWPRKTKICTSLIYCVRLIMLETCLILTHRVKVLLLSTYLKKE